jgi:hypothetical protein
LKEEKKEKEKKKRTRKFPVGTRPGAPHGLKKEMGGSSAPTGPQNWELERIRPGCFLSLSMDAQPGRLEVLGYKSAS